jgi:cytosine/uracil/thiamine/allantoin permease
MLIAFNAFFALIVSFFMLRRTGTPKRHVFTFLTAAIVSGIVAFVSFEVMNPYGGVGSGARNNLILDSEFSWFVGLIVGFVVAAVLAKIFRPKAHAAV